MSLSTPLTHKKAVQRIVAWMRYTRKLPVVIAELSTQNTETPDVIGFLGPGSSILVECKVSRADFLADKKKWFRREEDQGMGDVRYFAAPPGMLTPAELPEGWGLLEIHDRMVSEKKAPERKKASKRCEVKLLMSAIRRLELSTAVFVVQDVIEEG